MSAPLKYEDLTVKYSYQSSKPVFPGQQFDQTIFQTPTGELYRVIRTHPQRDDVTVGTLTGYGWIDLIQLPTADHAKAMQTWLEIQTLEN